MKTMETPAMPIRATETVPAEHLPPEFRTKLRPIPGTRYRVTAEQIEETDAEKLEALRADIARGLADVRAGRVHSHDDVFSTLKAQYPET